MAEITLTNDKEKRTLWWVYGISFAFLLGNAICIAKEFYWLNLLPPVLLMLYMALTQLDKLILFCVFLVPLSINLADQEVRLGLSLPVEPLLGGILLLYVIRLLYNGKLNWELLRHPVTIAILFNLAWIFITSITSQLPLVSFKWLLSRLWFVVPFYFIGYYMFADFRNTRRFLWLYIIPLTIVIGYTLYNHWLFGFEEDPAHWVMSPFYNDHTAYGAALAMFFPALIAFTFRSDYSNNVRIIAGFLLVIFTVALIFSFTRAAWVSLAAALGLYLVLYFRIKWQWIVFIAVAAIGLVWMSWSDIVMDLEQNRQDTSDDLAEHFESISNISTDASNLERINRWNSAFRMFEEKPILGFGPGTYQFMYAPYQLSNEKTIVSTNAGDMGNAHSEYIGPLAESGVFGMLSFLAVAIAIVATGWRLYLRMEKGPERAAILAVLLGIVTYLIHGVLNNFLDTDKASVPFWAFAAMLVAADIQQSRKMKEKLKAETIPD
ncbi:MAG TPA: O-antigen ligase family protein [Bacteroidia bacterium]|nr:O-antigen ligase family protein [Bacteroidia bacterium]